MDMDDEIKGGIQHADPLMHVGVEAERIVFGSGDNLERILAFLWMEENSKEWCTLDRLLCTADHPRGATQWDAMVAATAVQWLGTNCGRDLLFRALRQAGYEIRREGIRM